MTLRSSQIEVLKLAESNGGTVPVWRVAEMRETDNWDAAQILEELARRGEMERSSVDRLLGKNAYKLTDGGKEALRQWRAK